MSVVVVVLAMQAVAVAAWLVPASVHISSWPASGPVRIAYVASSAQLLFLSVATLSLAAVFLAWGRFMRSGSVARVAARLGPLNLLWLWAVPYLPWLPDRVPLLLVLAGPLRWVVAAAAIGAAVKLGSRLQAVAARVGAEPGRRVVFAVSLLLYLGFGSLSARGVGPGGDEPHYLIIAHSLLADRDLKIENNHVQEDYRPFFGGRLRPDFLRRGQDGEIYSIHAPGLAALMLLPYALAGYAGTVVLLCLLAALTALAIWDLAHALAGRTAAWITWTAACLTVPLVPHSWLIFPEIPGALVVAWAALWLWRPPADRAIVWFCRGLALAMLVWLHTKFVVLVAIFAVAFLPKLYQRWRSLVALYVPLAVSTVAWLVFFYVMYGEMSPEAPYGDYTKINVLMKNIPRGLLGLLADQKFGLLVYSPVYVFAVGGGWLMLRRPDLRYLGLVLIVTVAAFTGSTTRLYMWWGGSSAPARFLVPLVPCLAPMVAVAVAATRRTPTRALLASCLAASVGVAAYASLNPERLLLFSDARGQARLVELLQAGSPLALTLPTFTIEDWVTPLGSLWPWLLAAAVGVGAMVGASRWRPHASPFALLVIGALSAAAFAGVATVPPSESVREETARRGVLDLLWRFDVPRLRAFDYQRFDEADSTMLLARTVVESQTYPPPAVPLPPGSYEASVWFESMQQRSRPSGEIVVASAQKIVFGRLEGELGNPSVVPFMLAVPTSRLSVFVSGADVAASVRRTSIAARTVEPVSRRIEQSIRTMEPLPGRAGAHLVYANDMAYPEGGIFWTRGTGRARVLVATAGATRLVLTLSLGPMGGDVALSVGQQQSTVTVPPGEPTRVVFDVPAEASLVPVVVTSPTTFRPVDVDPAATDSRRLGCQVRIDLE